tara:strand:+ start:241 stop:552 length:312 start_codon:yes stop_codon:yes gene_type:complete
MGSAAVRTQHGYQFWKLNAARRRSRDEEFGFYADADDETEGPVFARRLQSLGEFADDVKVVIFDIDFSKGSIHCLTPSTVAWLSACGLLALMMSPSHRKILPA